jgi:hypothetical protein
MEKKEHELGEAEVHGAVLATVSRHTDERRRGTVVAERAMRPYRCSAEGVDGTRR